VFLKVKWKTRR